MDCRSSLTQLAERGQFKHSLILLQVLLTLHTCWNSQQKRHVFTIKIIVQKDVFVLSFSYPLSVYRQNSVTATNKRKYITTFYSWIEKCSAKWFECFGIQCLINFSQVQGTKGTKCDKNVKIHFWWTCTTIFEPDQTCELKGCGIHCFILSHF